MNYSVLGICPGLGVSLFPFRRELLGNIEPRAIFHTPGNEQWEANFKSVPLYKALPAYKDHFKMVDVIISSPDCGSGSVFRYSRSKKLGDHKQNASLAMFFDSISIFKPKFFYFENLENLFKSFPKEEFKEKLREYRLIIHIASVSHWGNSQKNRKRMVIIGIRRDISKKVDKYFKLPQYKEPLACKELYGDLMENQNEDICHVRENINENISIHARRKLTLREIQGQWKTRLKGKKRWETEPGFKFSTAPGVYRNLRDDFPATARKANRQFDFNGLTLSPRQLARIQGVPDDFKIYYDPNKSKYWINKGRTVVTKSPPMEISLWFKRKLEKALSHARIG
jgi:site-specific DNA-cytosine methylase